MKAGSHDGDATDVKLRTDEAREATAVPTAEHVHLGPGGEFDLIRRLAARWGDAALGLGDDCAVLEVPDGERLVASTDSSVDRVHFRRDWMTPGEIGWRAAAAAVSDLAAAGASPLGLMLGLTLPDEWRGEVDALADGIGALAREVGIPIVGGDLTRGGVLMLAVTALGSARAPLSRSGARPGDRILVTGLLGGPSLALGSWARGEVPHVEARERFVRPRPRLAEARWLAGHGARAAVDLSDGLASDLAHVAHASGVRITVDARDVPLFPGSDWQTALSSGEEYEIAVAIPDGPELDALRETFVAEFGLPLAIVGRVEAGPAEVELRLDGTRVDLPVGYDHFSE